jgi:hypothetical protein
MRRALLLAATLAVAAGSAGGNAPAKPEHEAVYGVIDGAPARLALLDRDTLEPIGRSVSLGYLDAFAYDSNGWLAYADGRRLRIIDPERMRPFTSIRLLAGRPVAVGWLKWDSIVVVTGTTVAEVRTVDWAKRKVVRTARVEGTIVASARGDRELVFLLAPDVEIGPARLLVIDPEGRARVIPVPRISVGSHFDEGNPPTGASRVPGLALDAERDVAYVVGDGLVAEVPLGGTATYHALRGTFAKEIAGSWRSAAWLGGGTLAVSGRLSPDGREVEPMGLELVDTRTWTTRLVDRGVMHVERWQNLALAWGEGKPTDATGLVAFDSSGAKRFRLFAGHSVWVAGTTPTRAYVQVSDDESAAVELPSGRVVARPAREFPFLLTVR